MARWETVEAAKIKAFHEASIQRKKWRDFAKRLAKRICCQNWSLYWQHKVSLLSTTSPGLKISPEKFDGSLPIQHLSKPISQLKSVERPGLAQQSCWDYFKFQRTSYRNIHRHWANVYASQSCSFRPFRSSFLVGSQRIEEVYEHARSIWTHK